MFQKKTSVLTTFVVLLALLVLVILYVPRYARRDRTVTNPTATPAALTVTPEPMTATPPEPTATSAPAALLNPSFEEQAADGSLSGWTHSGAVEAAILEDNGHSSDWRLSHKSDLAYYRVESSQVVTGLADDWYTLRLWVRSSGGQDEAYVALRCGAVEQRVHVPPTTPGYRWLQVVVSNQVTGGACTIRLVSYGGRQTWTSFDDLELVPGRAALSILGADISSLKKSEDMGGVYRYPDGTQADALEILTSYGMNYARLRVWVDPADGYHNLDELLAMAPRLKAAGLKLLVDFHYSDNWADPGKQYKPAAWKELDFEALKQALYDHTYAVVSALAAQGTPPDMVQIGNEINAGLLAAEPIDV